MCSPGTSGIPSGSSTTASWWFASRPTGAVRSIASGTSDASSQGEPPAFSRRDLEDGTDVRSREEDAVRRQANHRDHAVVAIQKDGVDGEPHPERVHGPGVFQQEPLVRLQSRPAEEPAPTLPQGLRDPHEPRPEAHLSHDREPSGETRHLCSPRPADGRRASRSADVVEPREDPPEQTEPRSLTPAIRLASARVGPRRLSGARDQSEDHVPEDQRPENSPHRSPTVGRDATCVKG
jgi:hypothetical protein